MCAARLTSSPAIPTRSRLSFRVSLSCCLHLGEEEVSGVSGPDQLNEEIERLRLLSQIVRTKVGKRPVAEVHDTGRKEILAAAANLVPAGHFCSLPVLTPRTPAFYHARKVTP